MRALVDKFAKAGLVLQMASQPFARGENAEDVFGLDIHRKLKGVARSEIFRIWPGADTNRIEVLSIDKKLQQLVLFVHEPSREFEAIVPYRKARDMVKSNESSVLRALGLRSSKDILEVWPHRLRVRRKTPDEKRKFLLGVDERQLFIAQLSNTAPITTVATARDSLKSNAVTLAEGRMPGNTVRQGEWFFVNLLSGEQESLSAALKQNRAVIERNVDIGTAVAGRPRRSIKPSRRGSGGNPHVAEELVRLPGTLLEHGFSTLARSEVYVRGKIRHVDHKTTKFASWRRVIRNAESAATAGRAIGGGTWID